MMQAVHNDMQAPQKHLETLIQINSNCPLLPKELHLVDFLGVIQSKFSEEIAGILRSFSIDFNYDLII